MKGSSLGSASSAILAAVATVALAAGCMRGGGGQATPTPNPTPVPSGPVTSFYMRAWQTQALAPQYTFSWLPTTTVAGGIYIDGQVAVPAIYPGPLWIGPYARPITQQGIDKIAAEARRLGLLGDRTDFTQDVMPGSILGHIEFVIDGKTYDLTGDPNYVTRCRCLPDAGSPAAFGAFWQEVSQLGTWLADELGPSRPYDPERLAVLVMPPVEAQSGITPSEAAWPLSTIFAEFGVEYGSSYRCGIVTGADLALLVPAVREANQLTRFVDSAGVRKSLQVRVLVPDEPSPCQ